MHLTINGKRTQITEPVFRQLRKIIPAYNRLCQSDTSDQEKVDSLTIMVTELTGTAVNKISGDELTELLKLIPELCGLKPLKPGQSIQTADPWGELYAHLSACFGWTYDYINDHMTLSRLEEIQRYWKKHPPTHQLAAAYMGYEYQDKQASSQFLAAIAANAKQQGLIQ